MSSKQTAEDALDKTGILAFDIPRLSEVIGLSTRRLYQHIERRDLSAKYSGRKRIVPVEEARRFLRDLPDEEWELS